MNAAAPPPAPAPAPPPGLVGRLDATKNRVEKLGAIATAAGGVGALVVAGIATGSGYVTTAYDWLTSASQTQSQVVAIDERVKVLEGDKSAIVKDREEMARLAQDLSRIGKDLDRAGVDVKALMDLQRRLELRVERFDAVLEMLRERR